MDVGIYSLNACRYLTGEEPAELNGYSSVIDHDGRFNEVEENLSWTMKFPSGVLASCNTTYGANMPGFYRVHGSKGMLHVEPAFGYEGQHLTARIQGEPLIDEPNPNRDPSQFPPEAVCHFQRHRNLAEPGLRHDRDVVCPVRLCIRPTPLQGQQVRQTNRRLTTAATSDGFLRFAAVFPRATRSPDLESAASARAQRPHEARSHAEGPQDPTAGGGRPRDRPTTAYHNAAAGLRTSRSGLRGTLHAKPVRARWPRKHVIIARPPAETPVHRSRAGRSATLLRLHPCRRCPQQASRAVQ